MTPEQLRLVRTTVVRLEVLDEVRPSVIRELALLAEAADDMPVFVRRARELGVRTQRRGMRFEHFADAEQTLMAALSTALGDDLTPDVERAWRRFCCLITETMLEGAAGAQFGRTQ